MADVDDLPVIPVISPNSYLLCTICGKLFHEPVINVKCGHTFCRPCVEQLAKGQNATKCPVDDNTCDLTALVVNRALQGQVDEIEIYCRYGLIWSESDGKYIRDQEGCDQTVKIGSRAQHEAECLHAFVSCPNHNGVCGRFKRKDISDHLQTCNQNPCLHKLKGCEFVGRSEEVSSHLSVCGFRGLATSDLNSNQMTEIVAQNKSLIKEVASLSSTVGQLEKEKAVLESQMEHCISCIKQLQQGQASLLDKLEKLSTLRRSPSAVDSRGRNAASSLGRSPSSSSLRYSNTPGCQVRHETWVMPFQFKCIGTLRGHSGGIWCLKTCGSLLFSSGGDNVIKVWELENLVKGCKQTLRGHTDKVQSLAAGEMYLYSGGTDQSIRVWSLADLSLVKVLEDAHDHCVAAMVCSEDYLFSSSHQEIKVWDATSQKLVKTISGLHHWVRCLALNSTKDRLYSGSHNTVEIWDAMGKFNLTGKITHTYGSVYSLAVTNKYIMIGTYNQNTHLFDVSTQQYLFKLSGHVGTVTAIVASPSGRFLFTASTDAHIQVWNLENKLPIHALSRHEDSVYTLALHGDLLLSGSEDKEIKVFKHFKLMPGAMPTELPAV